MSVVLAWLLRFFLFRIPFMQWLRVGMGLLLTFLIFLYVFLSMGLQEMARRQSIRGTFWAWVPIGQAYVAGAVADAENGGRAFRILLPLLQAAPTIFLLRMPDIEGAWWWIVVALVATFLVFYFIALGRIYNQYARFPAPLEVLSIIFWFLSPIFIFALRGNEAGSWRRIEQQKQAERDQQLRQRQAKKEEQARAREAQKAAKAQRKLK